MNLLNKLVVTLLVLTVFNANATASRAEATANCSYVVKSQLSIWERLVGDQNLRFISVDRESSLRKFLEKQDPLVHIRGTINFGPYDGKILYYSKPYLFSAIPHNGGSQDKDCRLAFSPYYVAVAREKSDGSFEALNSNTGISFDNKVLTSAKEIILKHSKNADPLKSAIKVGKIEYKDKLIKDRLITVYTQNSFIKNEVKTVFAKYLGLCESEVRRRYYDARKDPKKRGSGYYNDNHLRSALYKCKLKT
jgi:hypothetical protein